MCNPLSLLTPKSRIRHRETSFNLERIVNLRAATWSCFRRKRLSAMTPTTLQTSCKSKKKSKIKTHGKTRTTQKTNLETKLTGSPKLMNLLSILKFTRAKRRTITLTYKCRLWDKTSRCIEKSYSETNTKNKPVKTWGKRISRIRHQKHWPSNSLTCSKSLWNSSAKN